VDADDITNSYLQGHALKYKKLFLKSIDSPLVNSIFGIRPQNGAVHRLLNAPGHVLERGMGRAMKGNDGRQPGRQNVQTSNRPLGRTGFSTMIQNRNGNSPTKPRGGGASVWVGGVCRETEIKRKSMSEKPSIYLLRPDDERKI